MNPGDRIRVKATSHTRKQKLAGLSGVVLEDIGSTVFVKLPDAPDNPRAFSTSKFWRTNPKLYALTKAEVIAVQLDLFA